MKGDFSRKTFEAARHYSGVLMQQGRVQLDADWNEQLTIQRHRDYTEARDVIGNCGAPKHEAGFLIQPTPDGHDLVISPGRFYVHGRMCELEGTPVDALFQSATQATVSVWHVDGADFAPHQYVELSASNVASAVVRIQAADPATRLLTFASSIAAFQAATGLTIRRLTTYLTQPDFPNPPFLSPPDQTQPPVLDLPDGAYLLYLDVWSRHLTALNDDLIREKALDGPDTATRIKTVWQVKLWPGPDDGPPLPGDTECGSPVAGWDALVAPSTGRLNARTQPPQDTDTPCILPYGAGYLGLGNQLYRVEIHQGGVLGTNPISFKWSRDNGSVVKAIEKIPNTTDYTIHEKGPDEVLGLANGQWVEQVDDVVDLQGIARDLFQFQMDPVTAAVTLNFPVDEAQHPQLRRWDSDGEVDIPWPPVGDGWVDLENGIQVRFEAGTYRTGDYWLIPARTVLGDIEWPRDGAGQPVPQLRRGIHHHYCRIGVLHVQGGALAVEDCRPLFPPLIELKATSSCCTFTVGDGVEHVGDFTLIQEAVDHLPVEKGGQICIFPGTYVENVRIEGKKDIHIKGCGPRTRVVANQAKAEGVAAAVFHLVACERVKIESLAIEAAETAPGILVSKTPESKDVTLHDLFINAATRSAIEVQAGSFITVRNCRILMNDVASPWPGVFVIADDVLIENDVIQVQRTATTGIAGGVAAASAGRGGLQIGGTSERVRVINNLIEAGIGNGITLGTVEQLNFDGKVIGVVSGWVVNAFDPRGPCAPGGVYIPPPPGGAGDQPTYQSAGPLYDILIERNRILDMGLNGIGVVAFFNLDATDEFITVEGLRIVGNEIRGCLKRPLENIDADMVDAMGYGGIALADVGNLVIHHNTIEDNGPNHLEPICGIFVLHAEGLDISDNRITNNGAKTSQPSHTAKDGRRGGVNVVLAVAPTVPTPIGGQLYPNQTGLPAAKIHDNIVSQPLGQALSLTALGPVSVLDNHLTSRGVVVKLIPPSPSFIAATVAIVNLGMSNEFYSQLTNFSGVLYDSKNLAAGPSLSGDALLVPREDLDDKRIGQYLANGNVLFSNNRCDLNLLETGFGFALSSIAIFSLDDIGFHDNQCDCNLLDDYVIVQALLFAASLRASDNRFKEGLANAMYSAMTIGVMNATTNNQSTHCLLVSGLLPSLKVDSGNTVLLAGFIPNFCRQLKTGVGTIGFLAGGFE